MAIFVKQNGSTIKTSWSILEKFENVALNVLHKPVKLNVFKQQPQPLQPQLQPQQLQPL